MHSLRAPFTSLALVAAIGFLSSCDNGSSSSSNQTPAPSDSVGEAVAGAVRAPVFSPAGGTYTTPQEVTVTTATSEAYIYFTVDGTTPTTSSMLYSGGGIPVGASYTLKAIAVKKNMTTSPVTSAVYVISASAAQIPWKSGVTYGSVTHSVGQTYKTVLIGTQTWMAENLNFKGVGADTLGVCYNNSPDSCTKYGRLYKWSEVMQASLASSTSPSKVQGICPTSWHVPSDAEWTTLGAFVDSSGTSAGTRLKATAGWPDRVGSAGTDLYGFRALPSGSSYKGEFSDPGWGGMWWSTTESSPSQDPSQVKRRAIDFNSAILSGNGSKKDDRMSLRCIQD